MISVLYIIGLIVFIISIVVGFSSGSILGFLIALRSGISSAIIFFAVAKILENQENILFKLENQEEMYKKSFIQPKIACPKCNYECDNDYTSCPHCGYRV